MDIVFRNSKLEKEFSDEGMVRRTRGDRQAKLIMRRLAELHAVEYLEHLRLLPGPRCHELTGNMKGHFSVDLNHPHRLIFVSDNDPVPLLPDGGIDWKRITRIKILGVQDTHE